VSGRDPLSALTGLAALQEISKRLGQLGEHVTNAASGKGEQTSEQSFTINTPNGPVKGVSQMSFRVGSLSGRMPRQGAGARRPAASTTAERTRKAAPDLDAARPPLVDCFDEGDTVVITAELPGVTEDQLHITAAELSVTIETTGSRRYRTEEQLPQPVRPDSLMTVLRHGILELRLTKQSASA
jgi:HSP20 family protein